MTRNRIGLATALMGVVGLALGLTLTLTACGQQPAKQAASGAAAAGSDTLDLSALDTQELEPSAGPATTPATGASSGAAGAAAGAGAARRAARQVRAFLRRNILHGETVVKTKNGTATIAVQRGTVTAADAKTVTVKSADGVTQTWTYGDKVTVRKDHKKAVPSAVTVGSTVGVAGNKDGANTLTARLVVAT